MDRSVHPSGQVAMSINKPIKRTSQDSRTTFLFLRQDHFLLRNHFRKHFVRHLKMSVKVRIKETNKAGWQPKLASRTPKA
jgi:hypothetical protein